MKNKKGLIALIVGIVIVFGIVLVFSPYIPFIVSLLDKPDKPAYEHGEFPFEIVYEYKGETQTIKDTIVCDYNGDSYAIETGNTIDWDCTYENNDDYGLYVVDENIPSLFIVVPDGASYYMGEKDATIDIARPYIRYIDDFTGTNYEEYEKVDAFNVKIIEWKPSGPLK